ncbi:MAG: fused MFS/spermidine synthase [Acidobacteria bacterium]|nr:fused MFS/spermidine synthase [Acidobacteriota bacterium]
MSSNASSGRGTPSFAGIVLSLFFVSGALGLIYEVVWLRMLILVFGSTHFAVTTVLTAFMGGLALGAYLLGRRVDARRDPVKLYGLLEIGIGAYALAIPYLFKLLIPLSRVLWTGFNPSFYVFSLLRFFFVGAVLLVPCAFMGGTLPVLARFISRNRDEIGLDIGTLYGVNTFGAVVGAALTGFLLVPGIGVQATIYLAAALNVLLGLAALEVARRNRAASPELDPAPSSPASRIQLPADVRRILLVFACSGFIAMVYEIAWTRVLALVIGSSVYAFTVMLTTFLVGLAAGASLMSRVADRLGAKWGHEAVAAIMAGTGVAAFGTLLLFHQLPYAFSLAFHRIHGAASPAREQVLLFGLEFAMAGVVMLPPTLLLGGMFPLVVRICGSALPLVGRTVGTAYTANTIGTILGSALAGFAIVPLAGIQGSILLAVVANLLLAAMLLAARRAPESTRGGTRRWIAAGACVVAAASLWAFRPSWNALLMNSGVYQYAADMSESDLTDKGFYEYTQGDFQLLFYKEGVTAAVMVAGEKQTKDIWLSVNGKIDASSFGDLQTQLLSGHLPLLFADRHDDVVVIGYASGITVGAVTQYDIKSLTAVEIEPAILQASELFKDYNHDPLANPRVKVVTGDGRNFLLVTPDRYDVIISEPSNPWMTVASNLFTKEFFEIGRERLKPGGVFAQWLQLYGMQPSDLRALTRTFASVFPNVMVFNTIPDADLVLIGSDKPLAFDMEKLRDRMSDLDIALDLGRVRVLGVSDMLTYFIMGNDEVRAFAGEGELNTDDNALIEFHAPRSLHFETRNENRKAILDHAADPIGFLSERPNAPELKSVFYQDMAEAYLRRGMHEAARKAIDRALFLHESPEARTILTRIDEAVAMKARQHAAGAR